MKMLACIAVASVAVATSANAQELLFNPGFEDIDADGNFGDGWGSFGAAGFNAFFGPNGHASLFSDTPGNFGGVFQAGISAAGGTEYQFDLLDVRLEDNVDANYRFGLEFFQADDSTQISSITVPLSLDITGDGLSFSMTAVAPIDAVFVRPIIQFDAVTSIANGQENAFVFEVSLTVVPAPASVILFAAGGMVAGRRRHD